MGAAEKKAQIQANAGKLLGLEGQLLELANRHPRTNAAEQALIWLVTAVPSRPNRTRPRRSWRGTTRGAIGSSRSCTGQLEIFWASQAVEDLLRNASEQNPYREIRGLACYWLAEILRYRAQMLRTLAVAAPRLVAMLRQRFSPQDLERVLKQDPKALEHRAARLYDRVIAEFPFVANNDPRTERPPLVLGRAALVLPAVAKVRLDELHRLSVGKPAPEIEGVDLDGKPMKLSDFRGKVVVLSIPGFGNPGDRRSARRGGLTHSPSSAGSLPIIEGKPVGPAGRRRFPSRRAQESGSAERPADPLLVGPRPGGSARNRRRVGPPARADPHRLGRRGTQRLRDRRARRDPLHPSVRARHAREGRRDGPAGAGRRAGATLKEGLTGIGPTRGGDWQGGGGRLH